MMIMLKRSLLGNDFTAPTFWMHSFRAEKVMMLSDPKHWDHILPFMQPGDVPHRIALADADIGAMLAADGHDDGSSDMLGGEQQAASSKPMLQNYTKFKVKKVPQEAELTSL